jgi:antitoxin MazE
MKATVSVEQTIQEWGNGLAVRITAPVAKAARLSRGQPIRVEVVEGGVFLRSNVKPKLTLAQKLKTFDPTIHGGELETRS